MHGGLTEEAKKSLEIWFAENNWRPCPRPLCGVDVLSDVMPLCLSFCVEDDVSDLRKWRLMMFVPLGVDVFLIIKEVLSLILGRFVFFTFKHHMQLAIWWQFCKVVESTWNHHFMCFPPLSDGTSAFSSRMSRLDSLLSTFLSWTLRAGTDSSKQINHYGYGLKSALVVCNPFLWVLVCVFCATYICSMK